MHLFRLSIFTILCSATTLTYAQVAPSMQGFKPCTPITFDSQVNIQPLQIVHQYPSSHLMQIRRQKIATTDTGGAGNYALFGLYIPKSRLSLQLNLQAQSKNSGATMICIQKIQLVVQKSHQIYIASQIPNKSCTYNTTLTHELLHAQLERQAIDRAIAYANTLIAQRPNSGSFGNSIDQAKSFVSEYQNWLLKQTSEYYEMQSQILHQQIDNPQNYENESAQCGNESKLLARQMTLGH